MFSSDAENAKNQTQSARTVEVGEVPSQTNPRREKGIGDNSGNNGSFHWGNVGETGEGRDSRLLCTIAGGIITQLIEDAESQLGETRDCIKWYEDKEKEQLKRLESLQHLKQLREHLQTED